MTAGAGVGVLPLLAVGVLQSGSDPYDRGRALVENGEPARALQYWVAVRDSLTAAGAQDPRIATAFVATVAGERALGAYHEIAPLMFYWGFDARAPGDGAREELLAEGARTFALAGDAVADHWAEKGAADPAALAVAIKQFWIEADPTPTTPENERLMEHWSRIVHARRNYVYNRSSPYETDDRGLFYVKYGEPDRIARGVLGINGAERREWRIDSDFESRFDVQPQYEIWRYARPLQRGEFTYFLFGNTDGTGPFQLVSGLHEIIPTTARTSPLARHAGVRAWYYLEYFYYQDMARMGGPFGRRFDELDQLWNRPRAGRLVEGTLEAVSQRYLQDDVTAHRRPRPPSWSDVADAPRSALSAQTARILDGNEPRLLVLAVSSPLWRPGVDDPGDEGLALAAYAARHTAIARDHRMHELGRAGLVPADRRQHVSSVVLRHAREVGHVTVAAQHDVEYDRFDDADRPRVYPGAAYFEIGPPLARRPGEMEVSDLVVGIAPPPEFPLEDAPVPLLPATQFWREDLLRVYFELYRDADTPPDDAGDFDVRVQVVPLNIGAPAAGDPPGRTPPRPRTEAQATVEVSVESPGPTGQHFFDLDLRNERSGVLRIVLEVTDQETGAARTRATAVRLLER